VFIAMHVIILKVIEPLSRVPRTIFGSKRAEVEAGVAQSV
jgi:hypothetical protein